MRWIALMLIFFSFSCKSNEVKRPSNILDKDAMVNILLDIHTADGMATNAKVSNAKLLNQIKKTYLQSVLNKHDILQENFETSLTFYENHPQLLFEVYEQVMIEISTKEAEVNGKNKDLIEENKTKK